MIEISSIIKANEREAKALIEENTTDNYFEFDKADENSLPYILVCDREGDVQDVAVGAVELDDNDLFIVHIVDWDEPIYLTDAIGHTENNVFMAIYEYFKKQ